MLILLKYLPQKERCEDQHDRDVHGHDPLEVILFEVVGHVTDDIYKNCRQECGQNPTQESPLYDDLGDKNKILFLLQIFLLLWLQTSTLNTDLVSLSIPVFLT